MHTHPFIDSISQCHHFKMHPCVTCSIAAPVKCCTESLLHNIYFRNWFPSLSALGKKKTLLRSQIDNVICY